RRTHWRPVRHWRGRRVWRGRHERAPHPGRYVAGRLRVQRTPPGLGTHPIITLPRRTFRMGQYPAAAPAVKALEQVGVRFTFGIPGVHNTELYDELGKSTLIEPILVTSEFNGSFMAEAMSRIGGSLGCLVLVPAAGLTHAASGIGEAMLD